MSNPDKNLEGKDITIFRSLTCLALWACQTRPEELSCVTSLQTKLQTPQVSDLIEINACIKRLKKSQSRMGLWFRRMSPPFRVVVVTDARSANKKFFACHRRRNSRINGKQIMRQTRDAS